MAGRKKEELKITTAQTEKLLEFYQEEVDLWIFLQQIIITKIVVGERWRIFLIN